MADSGHFAGEFCFVFDIQSRSFLLHGDVRERLIGAGPSIVDRRNGQLIFTGSGHPTEFYVSNYEKFGDPYVYEELGCSLILKSWESGASSILAMKLLRSKIKGLGLKQSKELIDSCLEGESPIVSANSVEVATQLVDELAKLSFIAEQVVVRHGPNTNLDCE